MGCYFGAAAWLLTVFGGAGWDGGVTQRCALAEWVGKPDVAVDEVGWVGENLTLKLPSGAEAHWHCRRCRHG
jgi:hypothetical protein